MKMRDRFERTMVALELPSADALIKKAGRHAGVPDRSILNDIGDHYLQIAGEGDIDPRGYVRKLINDTLGNRSRRRKLRGFTPSPTRARPELHAAH